MTKSNKDEDSRSDDSETREIRQKSKADHEQLESEENIPSADQNNVSNQEVQSISGKSQDRNSQQSEKDGEKEKTDREQKEENDGQKTEVEGEGSVADRLSIDRLQDSDVDFGPLSEYDTDDLRNYDTDDLRDDYQAHRDEIWYYAVWGVIIFWSIYILTSIVTVFSSLVGFLAWISFPIAIYNDLQTVEQSDDWEPNKTVYLIGSSIPFINLITGVGYLYNRHTQLGIPDFINEESPSSINDTIPFFSVAFSTLGWGMLVAYGMINPVSEPFRLVLWVLFPASIYFDHDYVANTYEWDEGIGRNVYLVGSTIPVLNILTGVAYLYRRYKLVGIPVRVVGETVHSTRSDLSTAIEDVQTLKQRRAVGTDGSVGRTQTSQEVSHTSTESTPSPSSIPDNPSPAFDSEQVPESIPTTNVKTLEWDDFEESGYIGQGGNADVKKAQLKESEELIAVKQPRLSGTITETTVESMMEEAETWSKLHDHDHIVTIVDWGSEPVPWIAMEYMDEGSLDDKRVWMDVEQRIWTGICIVKAIRYAHRHGVAHLDLKPENILFRDTGENKWPVPKVADWGLSKMLLDHSQSVEGLSPQYAAPEQFDQDTYGSPDDRTDIYQTGAVLYELFTDKPVFTGESASVMREILNEEPKPPTDVNPDLPPEINDILLPALAKHKGNRHETLVDIRRGLEGLLEETPESEEKEAS